VAKGCHGFFFQAADWKNTAPNGDFTGHGDVAPDRGSGQRRDDRSTDGYAGGRPVFRHGAFREMDVDVFCLVEIGRKMIKGRSGTNVTHGSIDGFLHHIAEITSQLQFSCPVNHIDLDIQRLSAHARPGKTRYKTDLIGGRHFIGQKLSGSQIFVEIAARHGQPLGRIVGNKANRAFAADAGQFAFQISDTGFSCIAGNDFAHGVVGHADSSLRNSMLFQLLGQQMLLGDLQFFLIRIGSEFDDLHPVEQRPRNCLRRVCRRNKHTFMQIERNLQIVIPEAAVLLGIQHLEKRGGRIPFIIAAEFVDLIEQQQRIFGLCLGNGSHNSAGHRTDVGFSVAADLRFVMHAAQ